MQLESRFNKARRSRALMPKIVAVVIGLATGAAHADVVWEQNNDLTSWLSGTPDYGVNGTTATVTYFNQTATNTGSTTGHLGMYIGWNWIYDYSGNNTPLLWSNADQAFVGDHVSLKISRLGYADQYLQLGTVVGDTWISVPWSIAPDTPIATQKDWQVPLFDFGLLGAGDSVSYDIAFTYQFDSQAALDNFQSMSVSAQGVSTAVPEPASLALAGLALLAGALTRRRN